MSIMINQRKILSFFPAIFIPKKEALGICSHLNTIWFQRNATSKAIAWFPYQLVVNPIYQMC